MVKGLNLIVSVKKKKFLLAMDAETIAPIK